MKPAIYMFPGACSRVTMTAMEEIGIDYEMRPVDLLSGAQKSAEYLAINRKCKVPALAVEGRLLTENPSILHYLHRLRPQAALLPRSDNLAEDTQGLSDLIWCSSTLHPMVRQIRNPQRFTKGELPGVKADGMEKFAAECAYLSARFAGATWWYGENWSIVDTYLYWAYSTAGKGGFPVNNFPQLVSHAGRVRARPSFHRTRNKEIEVAEGQKLKVEISDL